jgi:hypothetical protein
VMRGEMGSGEDPVWLIIAVSSCCAVTSYLAVVWLVGDEVVNQGGCRGKERV